ncbi:MAG: hypothetical protein L0027_00285 [Candidatus Rokubacteria bacterium]|nr:hypothetical protein [Candidatus Rokubacteria bacterium]
MRTLIGIGLVLGLVLAQAPALAQQKDDVETLRREMEQMRKQFETMKDGYEKAMNEMADRLKALERKPQTVTPVAAPPAPARDPMLSQTPPPGSGWPSLMDLARPRQPYALYERRGPGQFLFDMGIAADFITNITDAAAEQNADGTFAGRENRIFPREIELAFFGQIDPYARGTVIIEAAEEGEGGERGGEITVSLSEAYLELLTLPFGTQSKAGRMRVDYGLLNPLHAHDLPQPDRPDVLVQFFGEEGLRENGAELSWVAPLPFYLQLLAGIFDGDNEVAFGKASLRAPLFTGRVQTFFDFGAAGAIQLGASVAAGKQADQDFVFPDGSTRTLYGLENIIWGVDLKYKLTPDGWRHSLFTVGSEALFQRRHLWQAMTETVQTGVDDNGDPILADVTTFSKVWTDRWGMYVYAEVQPFRRWLGGVRWDYTQYPILNGHEWAVEPYIAFQPSDFLRFRLAYKYTGRQGTDGFTDAGNPANLNEVFLQATFILGAHPAHRF